MITAEVIKNLKTNDVTYLSGNLNKVATKVLPPEICDQESLVFVGKADQLEKAIAAKAPVIIVHKSLSPQANDNHTFFSANSIQHAMAGILPLFDGKMNRFNQTEKIHPMSFIHPSAHIGKNVTIGAFVTIGENARIGDSCTIGSNSVIESDAIIGEHTLLHPSVFIGAHCEVGSHCEIHPHTTIGSDGFSFTMTANGEQRKIPQIGKVVIGNNVEIGANCAIDRAALTVTKIGNGSKLDNLCHIAHNVVIGENCAIAAGFKVAGSTTIGNNFMCGGEVAVKDHVKVADRVIIAGRSIITGNITESGQYGGYPLEAYKDHLRTVANLPYVGKLKKQVNMIMKHLNLNSEGDV